MASSSEFDRLAGYLLAFDKHHGFMIAWRSSPSVLKDNEGESTLLRFANFVSGVISQGGEPLAGIHGPFALRDIRTHQVLVYVFRLTEEPYGDSVDAVSVLFFFFILYPVKEDKYLTPSARKELQEFLDQKISAVRPEEIDEPFFDEIWRLLQQQWHALIKSASDRFLTSHQAARLSSVILQANEYLASENRAEQWLVGGNHPALQSLLPQVFQSLLIREHQVDFSFVHEKHSHSIMTFDSVEVQVRYGHNFFPRDWPDFSILLLDDTHEDRFKRWASHYDLSASQVFVVLNPPSPSFDDYLLTLQQKLGRKHIDYVLFEWRRETEWIPDLLADLFQERIERSSRDEVRNG